MFHRIVAGILIVLMFFQFFERASIVLYYKAYQDYIAQYLCINRNTPGSTCNGQCYLMKKIRESEKRQSTPVAPDNQKSEFYPVEQYFIGSVLGLVFARLVIHDSDIVPSLLPDGVFHPPKS